ncbi:hypothetical protein [Actinomadura sp. 3N407]|uniref:hypothetical protein n=1 Tax=Actinomadura sp. 3N407 TaxID=3457423 RepID=UPI003FCE1B20
MSSLNVRYGGIARALPAWEHADLPRPGGGTLRVTGVPAQHGPDGTEHLTGPVTGFVLTGGGLTDRLRLLAPGEEIEL